MPPSKKQRIDSDALPVAVQVLRHTTRVSAKAAQVGDIVANRTIAVNETKEKTKPVAPEMGKRVVRIGRLERLPDLAVEVQLEIYNYLDLGDLFNLAQTCKKFRAFFLDKRLEKKLWMHARANTPGVPDRPSFMSEYSFVHLLYSPHCHNCGRSNVRKMLDNCLIRLCSTCFQEQTIWYGEASTQARGINMTLANALFHFCAIDDYFPVQGYSSQHQYDKKRNLLLKIHVDRILKQYKALPTPVAHKTLDAFAAQATVDHKSRLQYAEAVSLWMKQQDEKKRALLEDARKQCFEAILARLRDAGWGKELEFIGADGIETISNVSVIRASTKLTEGVWQKVLDILGPLLSDARRIRLEKEFPVMLGARFQALEEAIAAHYVTLPRTPRMECRPQYIDFAFTPKCRAIAGLPPSETVTTDQFAAVVPALVEKWHADRRAELTAYLLPHLGDIAPDVDPLELAISFFQNKTSCHAPIGLMQYPAILMHHCSSGDCFRTDQYRTADELPQDDQYTRTTKSLNWKELTLRTSEHGRQFSGAHAPFHIGSLAGPILAHEVINIMRRIVAALGLDPARATFDDLERCEVWLRCTTCETREPRGAIQAMSWRAAYEHERLHICHWLAFGKRFPEWRHADDDDMKTVRTLHRRQFREAYAGAILWSCSLCPRLNANAETMTAHLEEVHDILDPSQARRNGTVYLHPSVDRSAVYADKIDLPKRIIPRRKRTRATLL